MKKLPPNQLPPEALNLIGETQRTYLDEFTFFQEEDGCPVPGYIEAWYAGELLAVWNGEAWVVPTPKAALHYYQ